MFTSSLLALSCLALSQISHEPLPDTTQDLLGYVVQAKLAQGLAFGASDINYFRVEYTELESSVSGLAPMTRAANRKFTAVIPSLGSPAVVEYRIHLNYTLSGVDYDVLLPEVGGFHFLVGESTSLLLSTFEGPAGRNQGWVHTDFANPSFDDWQHGPPGGKSGSSFGIDWEDPAPDPNRPNQIWGTDIRPTWDGAYLPDVASYLESPVIDATHYSNLKLRFLKWQTTAPGDTVSVGMVDAISGHEITLLGPMQGVEVNWSEVLIALPPEADGAQFRIRFHLDTNSGTNLGGWNLDNVEVTALAASPVGANPSNSMLLRGDTAISEGRRAELMLRDGIPGAAFEVRALVKTQWNPQGWSSGNHLFDLGPTYAVVASGTLDPQGEARIYLPRTSGDRLLWTYVFEAVVDTGAVVQDSNLLFLTLWP